MAYAGIDCATKLTVDSAKALKGQGITHVGRYLNPGWKGLTLDEVKAISAAGLEIVSVFETSPTNVAYFTHAQGKQDAQDASKYAKSLGQPHGSAIYFTVDYDAQGKDLGAILDYFLGVIEGIDTSFKVGSYGSYTVLQYVKQQSKVEYFFQTYAWSHGQVCDFAHLYQHENGVNVAGVNVDRDQINKEPGSWSVSVPQPKVEAAHGTYTIQSGDTFWGLEQKYGWVNGVLTSLNPNVNARTLSVGQVINTPSKVSQPTKVESHGTYTLQSGDNFWSLEQAHGWQHGTLTALNPSVDPQKLQIGQVINVPEPIEAYHVVQKDESLSVIASNNGISLVDIEKLNPQLSGHYDLIQPGEKVRVK